SRGTFRSCRTGIAGSGGRERGRWSTLATATSPRRSTRGTPFSAGSKASGGCDSRADDANGPASTGGERHRTFLRSYSSSHGSKTRDARIRDDFRFVPGGLGRTRAAAQNLGRGGARAADAARPHSGVAGPRSSGDRAQRVLRALDAAARARG